MKHSQIKRCSVKEIERHTAKLSGWILNSKATILSKTFDTETFISGLSFTAKIAVHAEILNHHPSIELSFSKVKVHLTTHDAKGLTKLDFDLAQRIDKISHR